ncbi:MAG: ATP-binding protein, partial [Bacteroidetes bacterium]|nr:ATP-binding protein [Bacteroidota bacterium]
YQHDFDELVYLTQKAGWITDEMNTVRTYLGQTLADVIADEDEQAELFLWIALGLILFSFVGGIAYAVYIARGIIKPLERMRTLVKQLVDGELRDDLEFDENGELGELADAFGELAEQVRMRIEAENHVKASRAKLQAYADELETTKSALEDRAQELSSIVSELQEAQNVAQHTIISKTLFLANMSHEIRTPLNGIIGMTSLLTSEELRPDQYEIVNVIRSSGESLLAIVNEILDHAKIEQGGVDLEEAKFDVTSCIEDALDMVFKLAADKALELSYLVSDDLPLYVVGDRARVRQILINLLANAVKFTKSGEVQVRAKLVERTRHEVELQLEVEDTGIGISEEAQEYLFDPFRQAEASTTRKFGGTGLGLSIASHLCELMGGKMWLESEVDKGSTFYFTLKLRRDPEHMTEDMISDFATDHRVLLLSQNVRFGSSVTTMIRQGGGEATTVENLKKGQATLRNDESVDLILIDDGDHKESALEKASKLKELAPDSRIVLFRAIGQRTSDELAPDRISKPVKRSSIKALFCEATCDATEEPRDAATEESRDAATDDARDAATDDARDEAPIYEIGKTPRRAADRKAAQKLGVLIVEDNETNQKVALKMLERLGYSADLAENGEDAVTMVAKNIYDIVFMDMMMPGMDGLEATREIRRNKDIALQPIIVAFTANATSNDRIQCLEAGMDDYTSKPVSSETFAKILERARLERKTRHGARLNSPTGPSVA